MNAQGKAVGPYEVYALLAGHGWDHFVDSSWTKLRGEGGVIEFTKELLHDGYRVAMVVDRDGHPTHMQYWGLAQPRTMKLEAGSYDFIEAQSVLFDVQKEVKRVQVELKDAVMDALRSHSEMIKATVAYTKKWGMPEMEGDPVQDARLVLLKDEARDEERVVSEITYGVDRTIIYNIPYTDELIDLLRDGFVLNSNPQSHRSMAAAMDRVTAYLKERT